MLLAFGSPFGGLIELPLSFLLKNQLHLQAHEVADFRLLAAIPLYLSVVFEWIMPHWSHAFTADWGDVAAYFAGALACFLIRERHFLRRG